MRALTLGLLLVSLPAAASEEFTRFITAASRLFENLEYERALDQLANAKKFAATPDEQAQVALYEGVVFTELGRAEDAKAAFETALFLAPDAQLPMKVSPKVKAQIEQVRAHVKKELAPIIAKKEAEDRARKEAEAKAAAQKAAEKKLEEPNPTPPPPEKKEPDRPVVARVEPLPPPQQPEPKVEPPPVLVEPPPQLEKPRRGFPVVPVIFAAGGVGSIITAAVFGAGSQSLVSQAMSATFQNDASDLRQQAAGKATIANVMFGVSAAFLVATIIAFAVWGTGP